jgi:hypothetical protein
MLERLAGGGVSVVDNQTGPPTAVDDLAGAQQRSRVRDLGHPPSHQPEERRPDSVCLAEIAELTRHNPDSVRPTTSAAINRPAAGRHWARGTGQLCVAASPSRIAERNTRGWRTAGTRGTL